MDLLSRCRGDAMNRFKNWQVLGEKVTGNGVTRIMISDRNEIAKFHFVGGKDIDGVYWELVFYCGRVSNQMVLF